ncbi:MAG TPA: hypothetical protein VL492_03550 [Methylovirgula sp.]|nr:hypothetical protein [Methylovirgula sp.]
MRRHAFVLGLVLLIAAPFAGNEVLAVIETQALKAEVGAFAERVGGLTIGAVKPSHHALAIEHLSLTQDDLTLRIGHLSLPVRTHFVRLERFVQASADDAENQAPSKDRGAAVKGAVSADDVSIDTKDLHVIIKHVELTGTSLSKTDLLALFDANSTTPVSERLAKISATHVAIPEIEIDIKPKDGKTADAGTPQKIVLHDVSMDNVVQGRAGHVAVVDISATLQSSASGEMQAALGPTRIADVDLPKVAALMAGTLQQDAQAIPLCGSLDVNGVKMTVPETKAEIGIATVALKQVNLAAKSDKPASSGLGRFDIALLDFTDLRFSRTEGTTTWAGRAGHGALKQLAGNKVSEGHVENVSIAGEGATVTVGNLGWQGEFLLADPALAKPTLPSGEQKLTADALAIDLTGTSRPEGTPNHFQLSHFELTSHDPVDGIPTHSQARMDHFTFSVAGLKDSELSKVHALGYDKVDLSSQFESHFEPTTHAFTLDGWSLTGTDMGALHLGAQLDQVSSGLFSPDQTVVEAAAVKVLLRQLDVKVDNAGLFDKIVADQAKRESKTPEAVKAEITQAISTNIPAILNNGRGTDVLVAALTKFVANPKNLRIGIKAPDGIGALDTVLIKDPATLLQKLEITATADE